MHVLVAVDIVGHAPERGLEGVELALKLRIDPGGVQSSGIGAHDQAGQGRHGLRAVRQRFGQIQVQPEIDIELGQPRGVRRNVGPSVRQLTALMRPSAANEIMASSMSAFMPKSSPHTITCLIKNSPRTSISARPHARPVQTTGFCRRRMRCRRNALGGGRGLRRTRRRGAGRQPVGWLVAFAVSFIGHYRLTFRHSRIPWTIAIRRFFLVSAAGFLVNESAYAAAARHGGPL